MNNFENFESLVKFINKVNTNDILYNNFLQHKTLSKVSNEFLEKEIISDNVVSAFQCFICEKAYEGALSTNSDLKNIENIYNCPKSAISNKTTWHQHWDIGKCQAKVMKMLIEKGVPFESDYFDKIWKKLLLDNDC